MAADSPDWLGACRRSAEAIRAMLAERPTIAERVMETGTRGEGGDRTLQIDAAAEDVVFAELSKLHDDGARFTAVSEERGVIDFGDPDRLVVIDPIDGSLNAKRGLAHFALSIAVSDGPTMADVKFGFVQDFGPQEEWVARRGKGAELDGKPLDTTLVERRNRDGKLEVLGLESADPRWVMQSVDALEETSHRLRAIGAIARLAVPGRGRPLRRDGLAQALSRRRCRGRAADRARGGRPGGVHRLRGPAGRAAGPRAALARDRRAHASKASPTWRRCPSGRESPAATLEHVIDWNLAGTVARGVANMQPAGDPTPFEQLAGPAEEAVRLVSAYTGLVAADAVPVAEPVDRSGWIDANLKSLALVLEPAAEKLTGGAGPLRSITGGVLALEAGAVSGFLAGRVLGQYEFPVLEPEKPARLLFVAPNLAHAAKGLDAPPDQLLRWVALHELTHALQFGGVPWLRPHLAELLREVLGALELDPRGLLRVPDVTDLKKLLERVREDGLAVVVDRRRPARHAGPHPVLHGRARGLRRARHGRRRRDRARRPARPARGARAPPPRPLGPAEAAGQAARHGPQAAPVRAGQGVLRRRRRARGDRGLNRVWWGPEALPTVAELQRPRGLAAPHRAAPLAQVRVASNLRSYLHKVSAVLRPVYVLSGLS